MSEKTGISWTALLMIFVAWPFVAAAIMACIALILAGLWIAIPFLNPIAEAIDSTSEFGE